MPQDLPTLRAFWSHRQGLDGSLAGATPASILAHSGWARSVAGCGPYLTIQSRSGASREAIDQAVAQVEIHELPSARGCTYVLPASDYALGLQVGQPFREAERKVGRSLGVTEAEIDKLCVSILTALSEEPLEPEQIRARVGGDARSLGEAGKKKGVSTTIPLALGALQAHGEIRRISLNGRLDQQRYKYARWMPNPTAGRTTTLAEAQLELASRYFGWIGAATLAEFQWFSGLSAKTAKAATAPLGLVPVDEYLLTSTGLDELKSFRIPKEPQYSLVSSLDSITALRRNLDSLAGDGVLGIQGHVAGIENHIILDRGQIIGLWDYDPATQEIVWKSFIEKTPALLQAVRDTETFVREQLGDARSFSLDSPQSRIARLAALR
jgi:hypothetical protein